MNLDVVFTPEEINAPRQTTAPHKTEEDAFRLANNSWPSLDRALEHGGGVQRALNAVASHCQTLEDVKQKLSLPFGPVVLMPPVKSKESTLSKVTGKYAGDWTRVSDLIRGTVATDTVNQMQAAAAVTRREMLKNGYTVAMTPEDKSSNPGPTGYRDIALKFRAPSGVLAEVLIMPKTFCLLKNGEGHRLYEECREIERQANREGRDMTTEEKSKIADLATKSKKMYDDAWVKAGGKV